MCVCVESLAAAVAVTLSRPPPSPPTFVQVALVERDRNLFSRPSDSAAASRPSVFRLLSRRRGYRCYAAHTQSLGRTSFLYIICITGTRRIILYFNVCNTYRVYLRHTVQGVPRDESVTAATDNNAAVHPV